MNWTTIDSYLDAPSHLNLEYCRTLFNGCALSQQSAYEWLYFLDTCGVEDKGDYYTHSVYPEVNRSA
jgi:hypothetical protein